MTSAVGKSVTRQGVVIPVIVCAKNEERAISGTLDALVVARAHAEARSPLRFAIRVVLDDTTDGTRSVVLRYAAAGVELRESDGGKVEAQRVGLGRDEEVPAPPFAIFCDADVRPSEDALLALATLLLERPEVEVATCALRPMPPNRRSLLAAAIHTYNARRGFSSSRTWFNGKLFAMRAWSVPTRAQLATRIAAAGSDAFYDFGAGLVIDDIYLSRVVVAARGTSAIAESAQGVVAFRAPETLRGMHRYYRRMRRELERVDRLFPETRGVHLATGRRRPDLLENAPMRERVHYALFSAALLGCRAAYVTERALVRHVWRAPRRAWPPIPETKAW